MKNFIIKFLAFKSKMHSSEKGFSILEVILASGAFVIFSIAMVSVALQAFDANRLASEETIAAQYASEGIEAVRSIKNQNFSNLVATGSTGIATSSSTTSLVTADATASAGVISSGTLSVNITTGSQSNRILIVGISTGVNNSTVSKVEYGAGLTPLTKLTTQNCSSTCRNEIWYLLNPATGTNAVKVTVSTADQISFGALTYYNVNQTTPFGTPTFNTGTGTSPTVTVPGSTAGQLVIDSSTSEGIGACPSASGSPAQLWSVCTSVNSAGSAIAGSSGSLVFSWTLTSSQPWAEIAIPVNGITSGTVWGFNGTNNTFGKYTRVISISSVQRDVNGNIVASGGSVDGNIMKAISTVSWNESPTRNDSVVLTTYMAKYK